MSFSLYPVQSCEQICTSYEVLINGIPTVADTARVSVIPLTAVGQGISVSLIKLS